MPLLDNARTAPSARTSLAGDRHSLVRRAFLLEWLTLAWMLVETVIAVAAAVAAHSLTLLAFGIDSLIELISACVLLWRLRIELKHGQRFSEHAERTATRLGGGLLFTLALYVVASAALSFWQRRGQNFSAPGLALTIAAIPIMWWLSRRKLAIAEQLGSRALRTDAMESITCGYLSVAVVAGLLAQLLLGAWWIDGVTSLAIVYFLVKEGREAWYGDECCAGDE
jgi:divalent metal cation (Fe/Co/Zn/Cd) transporter